MDTVDELGNLYHQRHRMRDVTGEPLLAGAVIPPDELKGIAMTPTTFQQPSPVRSPAQRASSSCFGNVYLFTGRRFDNATGLYYYRNRYYEPTSGRFISRDPLGYHDSLNVYAYVRNNPVNRVDPLGLDESVLIPKFVRRSDGSLSRGHLQLEKADFDKTIKKAFSELLEECKKHCKKWKDKDKKSFILKVKQTAAQKEFEIDGQQVPITDPQTGKPMETINTQFVGEINIESIRAFGRAKPQTGSELRSDVIINVNKILKRYRKDVDKNCQFLILVVLHEIHHTQQTAANPDYHRASAKNKGNIPPEFGDDAQRMEHDAHAATQEWAKLLGFDEEFQNYDYESGKMKTKK